MDRQLFNWCNKLYLKLFYHDKALSLILEALNISYLKNRIKIQTRIKQKY